jgi:aspartyl-tRNA(Asn)/glutamyl-tRNA(Gln) amidotransferase subunit A
VVGLKPTYGAVSRYGLLAMASSLDQIGPFASNVAGAKIGFDVVKGIDALDSTSQDATYLERKESYTIGVPKQFFDDGLDPRIADSLKKVLNKLEADGHTIKEIDLPLLSEANPIYYIIVPAEVSSNLARYDGIRFGIHADTVAQSRSQGFGDEVKRRIMLGTYALSAGYADQYYKRAQAARAGLRQQLLEIFKEVDMLFGPVSPEFAFKIGEKSSDPLAMYLSDIYTVPVNLAGLPGLSLPVEWVDVDGTTLPVAAQLIGAPWSEERLFDVGQSIEQPKE